MKSENNIPKFDLAEQILAEQRKTASVKRKAPDRNRDSKTGGNNNSTIENKTSTLPVQKPDNCNNDDKIIAEIVARDIRQIRTGN
jgi:hypothetical protein